MQTIDFGGGDSITVHFESDYIVRGVVRTGLLMYVEREDASVRVIVPERDYNILLFALSVGVGCYPFICERDVRLLISRTHSIIAAHDFIDAIAFPVSFDEFEEVFTAVGNVLGGSG